MTLHRTTTYYKRKCRLIQILDFLLEAKMYRNWKKLIKPYDSHMVDLGNVVWWWNLTRRNLTLGGLEGSKQDEQQNLLLQIKMKYQGHLCQRKICQEREGKNLLLLGKILVDLLGKILVVKILVSQYWFLISRSDYFVLISFSLECKACQDVSIRFRF